MSETKCGCKIYEQELTTGELENSIVYCPLHASADLMAADLEAARAEIARLKAELARVPLGDTVSQAQAWCDVFNACIGLGMKSTELTGRDQVLQYLARLRERNAKLAAVLRAILPEGWRIGHED